VGSKYIYIYILKRNIERYLVLVGWALTLQHTLHHTVTHTATHTATHCNTLQHTAPHCNTMRGGTSRDTSSSSDGRSHCNTHCDTLQHTVTHCEGGRREIPRPRRVGAHTATHTATHCNILQHTATHCTTLQHTARRNVERHLVLVRWAFRRLQSSNQRQRLRFGSLFASRGDYGVAATSRLLKIIGLFCKRGL